MRYVSKKTRNGLLFSLSTLAFLSGASILHAAGGFDIEKSNSNKISAKREKLQQRIKNSKVGGVELKEDEAKLKILNDLYREGSNIEYNNNNISNDVPEDCYRKYKELQTQRANRALRFTNGLPKDVKKIIFEKVSKHTLPTHLALVCKDWYRIMCEKDFVKNKGVGFSNSNPFMEKCMKDWFKGAGRDSVYGRFCNYALNDKGMEDRKYKFSELDNPFKGTFKLDYDDDFFSDKVSDKIVITTDPERFFIIGEENKGKEVVLIALQDFLRKIIKDENHPFYSIIKNSDSSKHPVAMFWRKGDQKDTKDFNYINDYSCEKPTRNNHKNVASHNLYRLRKFCAIHNNKFNCNGNKVTGLDFDEDSDGELGSGTELQRAMRSKSTKDWLERFELFVEELDDKELDDE